MPPTAPLPLALFLAFDPGGTERQMIELARRLDRSRWRVHVVCFRPRGAWYDRAASVAASVKPIAVTSFKSPRAWREMLTFARWCRATGIVVVHTTELWSNTFGLPGAALAGVPVRVGNRRELNPDKSLAKIVMQRLAYACAHTIVANSQAAADRLRFERVPDHKIAVVPNGLDASLFSERPLRSRLRTIAVVANLRREKGHDVLVDAAPQVLQRFPDARFMLVGAGREMDALVARARRLGVGDAFTFLGHCDDVPARLKEADIFVLPSRSEAFPNAVLEAMAAGLPIVASAVGGVREAIDHERTGILVPPDDRDALAAAMCRAMAEPVEAARLGAAAREHVQSRFDFERMVAGFEAIYLRELARRRTPAAERAELAAS